jgi:hypothetical protein
MVERRMQPGAWDPSGFLTPGSSLADVLARDADTVRRLGMELPVIGEKLQELLRAGGGSDVFQPTVVGDYAVEVLHQRGLITCPWAPEEFEACPVGQGARPTANRFIIRHRPSGTRIEGFELSIHLIRDHGFFGGPDTRFRIDPKRLASLLGVGR